MPKPEKRILKKGSPYLQYDKGFNHCRDEYDEWIDEVDIEEIIKRQEYPLNNITLKYANLLRAEMAKAIRKAIKVKEQ